MGYKVIDPIIEELLREYRMGELHTSDDTVYAIRPDLTFVYFNQGWSRFAVTNGGSDDLVNRKHLGSSLQDFIPQHLSRFFADNFATCLESRSPWQHRYECSSAEVYREFLMTAYPLGKRQGLLIVNSLCLDSRHIRVPQEPVEERYRNPDGLIVQCVHCRRIRRTGQTSTWDWVPEWLNNLPKDTSHGLCEPCFGYFYPADRSEYSASRKIFRTDYRQ